MLLNPNAYRLLIRPLLFRLPPETAQKVADVVLKQQRIWRILAEGMRMDDPRLQMEVCGLKIPNPVGIAAGYDKNCEFLPSLASLGFGYVVGGTVTETPRLGNPKPRLRRNVNDASLVNSLGFPGRGLEFAVRRLEQIRGTCGSSAVVVSVSGTTMEEIVRCHHSIEPLVDVVEINISSPNTAGLRLFQETETLALLLDRLNEGRRKPLFVKLPHYTRQHSDGGGYPQDRARVLGLANACVRRGVEGLTVANTRPTQDLRLAVGQGGLSGKPVFSAMIRLVADIRAEVGNRTTINACGGIFSGADAWEALEAGATTVQLLTSLIYRGPGIAKEINQELLTLMDK